MHDAINILTSFVRTVHLKRVMHAIDPAPRLNFWRVIYGNSLDIGVIDWCKLFGSIGPSHIIGRASCPRRSMTTFGEACTRKPG